MRHIFTSWLDFPLVFVPVAVVLEVLRADPLLVLLNASLGNAAELIIALVAMREGLHDVVKASLTGSIIGNILLVFGVAMFAGGLQYERQKFNQTASGMGADLLLLSAVGLIIPTLFHLTAADRGVATER